MGFIFVSANGIPIHKSSIGKLMKKCKRHFKEANQQTTSPTYTTSYTNQYAC